MNRSMICSMTLFLLVGLTSTPSWAISLNTGAPIIAIDGDSDGDVSVLVQSTALIPPPYQYGYFLTGGSFVPLGLSSMNLFAGGDIIDFTIFNGTTYYTLSGDAADDSYSVLMDFGNPVTVGSPQQPGDWSEPYYYNANITWNIPLLAATNTNELTLNFSGGNDGVAPFRASAAVPEPGTLLLLGTALLGLATFARKEFRRA